MKTYLPKVIAILIILSGLYNVVTAFLPQLTYPIDELEIPVNLIYASWTSSIMLGFFLLFLARGLWQQKFRAWLITMVLLLISLVQMGLFFILYRYYDITGVILIASLFIVLLFCRPLYTISTGRTSILLNLKRYWWLFTFFIAYIFLGYFSLQGQFEQKVTYSSILSDYSSSVFGLDYENLIPKTPQASWFKNSVSEVSLFAVILAFFMLLAPIFEREKPTEEEEKIALGLVSQYGYNSSSCFALMDDKSYFFSQDYSSMIAYKVSHKIAMVLGDPIGPKEKYLPIIKQFMQYVKKRDLSVAFYNISEQTLSLYKKLDMKYVKTAEEALINPSTFTLQGSAVSDLRHSVNRMQREQVRYEWHQFSQIPWTIQKDIINLHEKFSKKKSSFSLTFSLDYFPFPIFPGGYVLAVYSPTNELWGAFSYFPYANHNMVLDLMLRTPKAPNGMAEAAICESIRYFNEGGKQTVSLGGSPLANVQHEENKTLLDNSLQAIYKHVNQFYGFKSLFSFKQKFQPVWESKYLVYSNHTSLPRVALALLNVHLKENLLKSLFR